MLSTEDNMFYAILKTAWDLLLAPLLQLPNHDPVEAS